MVDFNYVLAGAITGLAIGFTGVGGGALMTPILLLFFGVSPSVAIATDLWFAALTKMVGARVHYAKGNVDWQVVKRLWMGSLPVALFTVILVSFGESFSKVGWLTSAIGIVVLVTAVGMILSPILAKIARSHRKEQPGRFKALQPGLTVVAGVFIGVCVALTSIGAGALGCILLLYLYPLRMCPHRLVATDIVHAIPLAVVAGMGYLIAGKVDFSLLFSLLVGSIPAVYLGSRIGQKTSGRSIQIALAVVLIIGGVKVLL